MTAIDFDYEHKVWGEPEVQLSPSYIQSLKLEYCLDDLRNTSGRLLDVGCGAGNMPKAIKRYRSDLEVWGADLSMRAIRTAQSNPGSAFFIHAMSENIPVRDGYFDAVTMFDVLEHIPEPRSALREIRRVLKPGGIFHIFLPLERQPYTIYALLHRLGWSAKKVHCGHIHFFTDTESSSLLRSSGFEVKNLRWSYHPIFAFVDVAYFTLLSLRGKQVSTSVEGFTHRGERSLANQGLRYFKDVIVSVGYFESRILRRWPGGGGHFSAKRV